jgi:hypothetical protein
MKPLNKTRIFYLSCITLFGMGAVGILLIKFLQKQDPYTVLAGEKDYGRQIISGLVYGLIVSGWAVALLYNPWFKGIRSFFAKLVQDMRPNFFNILFYSFCAGVGEEILFRAGIQPLIGIWPTSLLFVFLHGYINPSNMNLTVYGIFLVVICAGFGYLFKLFGIGSSITAHFVYDVAMFSLLRYSSSGNSGTVTSIT